MSPRTTTDVDLLRPTCATTARASRSPCRVDLDAFDGGGGGLAALGKAFDAEHERLFSFVLDAEHELVNAPRHRRRRRGPTCGAVDAGRRRRRPVGRARVQHHQIWSDGGLVDADVYDRSLLRGGQRRRRARP